MPETADRRLSEHPSTLHERDVRILGQLGERQCVVAEERLARVGSRVERLWLVREGHVHLRTPDPCGGRRTVAVVCSGGMVGDIPLFRGGSHTHDLVVGQVPAVLVAVDADDVRTLTHRSAGLAHRWMGSMICRLEAFERRALLNATTPLRTRLAALLLDARRPPGRKTDGPVVRLSQQTIAQLLGASRPAVSRAVGDLRREGLIRTAYRCIEVCDLSGLVALTGDRPGPAACATREPRTFLA